MPEINLQDFLNIFRHARTKGSVQLLQQAMSDELLKNNSAWVLKFREQPEPPAAPPWPLTKNSWASSCSAQAKR